MVNKAPFLSDKLNYLVSFLKSNFLPDESMRFELQMYILYKSYLIFIIARFSVLSDKELLIVVLDRV